VILARSLEFTEEWKEWKYVKKISQILAIFFHYFVYSPQEHKKSYEDEAQELKRYKIWLKKRAFVQQHNAGADQHGYTVGLNHFSDLTTHEYQNKLTYRPIKDSWENAKPFILDPSFKAEKSLNWTAKGAVTSVGNEFQCGSCWAFSATGALEGQHFLKTGKLVSLSEQQLMDCSTKDGNHGCEGGLMSDSYKYIMENGGIDTEASYPYTGKEGKCKFNSSNIGATCTGYVKVAQNESALFEAVQNIGPVAVAMDASHISFEMYKSGVYYEPQCSSTRIDHTLLAVGFGTLNGKDYWLCKNSWGTSWGSNGYVLMARNRDNNCGIATQASYPTV